MKIQLSATLHTDGEGLWSGKAAPVRITGIGLGYLDDDLEFGELVVHFDQADWEVQEDGLIYTDPLFKHELAAFLASQGYDATDIGYSEQGMQSDTYVSLDAGPRFLASFKAKHPAVVAALMQEMQS
jgi:hypothetical protein